MGKIRTDWKILSQKILLKNKFLEIWEDQLELPDKTRLTYYIQRKRPFSIVIPVEDTTVFMVRQYRYPVSRVLMEFPMGYAEGKTPHETAVTELKEETGIVAETLTEIGHFWVGPGRSNQMAYVYLAKGLEFGDPQPEPGEILELERLSIDQVGDMIQRGEVCDAPTIVSYHFLENYMKENTL